MSLVLADSVGLLALWNQADQWHRAASLAYDRIYNQGDILVTTSFVLLECGNAASRTMFRRDVDDLRLQMHAAGTLHWPTDDDWREAWAAYRRGEADQAGIVDHVSFVVMRRLNIRQAFTNDNHFRAAGFEVLFD